MITNEIKRRIQKVSERYFLGGLVLFMVGIATAVSLFAAEKLPQELENVGIEERLGAQVDLNLTFRNEKGELVPLRSVVNGRKPVLLFLAYYGCPNLCNLFLNGATESLKNLAWTAGNEFQIVTVSIDPRETPELASKKKLSHLKALGKPEAATGWHFWVSDVQGDAEAITNAKRLSDQVGFKYRYDKDQDQYAHSAAMIVLTPEGKISRYLFGIEFQPKDLRLALVEAGGRKIGTLIDHILLFCYNYDPKTKKYSLYATNLMRAGGGVTVLAVGSSLALVWRRNRRKGNGKS
ncbi:MAG: SCO family protein [Bdellovibrionota bacterium]